MLSYFRSPWPHGVVEEIGGEVFFYRDQVSMDTCGKLGRTYENASKMVQIIPGYVAIVCEGLNKEEIRSNFIRAIGSVG